MKKMIAALMLLSSMYSFAKKESLKCIDDISALGCMDVKVSEGFVYGAQNIMEFKCAVDVTLKGTSGRLYFKEIATSTHIDEKAVNTHANTLKEASDVMIKEIEQQLLEIKSKYKECH